MLVIPTIIMLGISYTSLVISIKNKITLLQSGKFIIQTDGIQLVIAVLLLILGILVAFSCAKKLLEREQAE